MKNLLILCAVLLISTTAFAQNYDGEYFTDQSGKSYKTVTIGNQVWMAENLKTDRYANGDPIEYATSVSWFVSEAIHCEITNGQNLYSWEAIKDNRGIAPQGWHVPTPGEWKELMSYCRSSADLKSTSGWPDKDYGGHYSITGCSNCSGWSSEYRSKWTYNVCNDDRLVQGAYVEKTSYSKTGNNRLGFNVKNLGLIFEGDISTDDYDNMFWTSVLNTDPRYCGSVCGMAYVFDLRAFRVTWEKHHKYLLPVRLVKD